MDKLNPQYVERVEQLKFEAYAANHSRSPQADPPWLVSKTTAAGEELAPNPKALQHAVLQFALGRVVHTSRTKERNDKGITKDRLIEAVFPDAPGIAKHDDPHPPALEPEELEAQADLFRDSWNILAEGGWVEKELETRDEPECNLLVVEAPIGIQRGKVVHNEAARFLTDNEELVVDFRISPDAKNLQKAIRRRQTKAEIIRRRMPALTERMARIYHEEINAGVGAFPLGDPTRARSLTTGNGRPASAGKKEDATEAAS